MSLILTQNKTNTKIQIFQSLQNNITHTTTHTHSNIKSKYKRTWKSTNIYDIITQRQELDKEMLIENTPKGKLNSQQLTNTS